MVSNASNSSKRHGAGYWSCVSLGVLLILLGILLGAGGIWLIALGGSWYYLFAGLGLIVSGVLLAMASLAGVWAYLLTYLFTVVWALWEVGTDWWAQVPRLVAPTLMLIPVMLCILPLSQSRGSINASNRGQRRHAIATAGLLLTAVAVAFHITQRPPVLAQERAQIPPPIPMQEEAQTPRPAPQDPIEPAVEAVPVEEGEGVGELEPLAEEDEAAEQNVSPTGVRVTEPSAIKETGENWPAYGGTVHGTRYSPLDQVNRDNVGRLERIWEYRTGDMPPEDRDVAWSPETTPLKIGDSLYLCTPTNIMISIDARTGREEWRFDPKVSYDAVPHAAACRGVTYYEDPEAEDSDALCATRIIEATLDARLIAVDARLGQPCTDFGINGEISLEEGLGDTVPGWVSSTSAPTIVRNIIVVGHQVNDNEAEDSPSGVVRGYDAVTGELAWAWDLEQPELDGEPPEGQTYSRGTPNMWTTAAADEDLGYVYLPLGNSAVDYYGSNRSEAENEYATSLVAIDVTTGEDVWHFQTVYRDVWDYDLGSQPALVDFPTEGGGAVPAIILSSKQGDIYILNRKTGEPLFEPEEREVPQGGVEPDYISPVQPFSTYHTLAFDPIEPWEMWGMSPLDQLWCRIQYHRATYEGMYTPPTHDTPYIQYPGFNGGQDWGSMAVDVERGLLIANYNDIPNFNQLITHEEARERGMLPVTAPGGDEGDPQLGAPYAIDVNPGWRLFTGLMCKEPPYGGIRAIDLATGETRWDHPFGTARANGPFGIPSLLPFTIGTPNNGGPIVTAGGVIFIAATTDNMIRAYDIETGEELWSDVLPAGGQATPITYELGGRQYLALMAGGHAFMETPKGDYVWAWALPSDENVGSGGATEPPPNQKR